MRYRFVFVAIVVESGDPDRIGRAGVGDRDDHDHTREQGQGEGTGYASGAPAPISINAPGQASEEPPGMPSERHLCPQRRTDLHR